MDGDRAPLDPPAGPEAGPDDAALDAYSRVVSRVAAELTPRVASLRVRQPHRRGGYREGAGSAVVFTADGFLVTNAHASAGRAAGRWRSPTAR